MMCSALAFRNYLIMNSLYNQYNLEHYWLLKPPEVNRKEDAMFISKRQREIINAMFVPPQDYDTIQIQTPETSDEPVLIITLYKNKQVVFFHNYELESDRLEEIGGV